VQAQQDQALLHLRGAGPLRVTSRPNGPAA